MFHKLWPAIADYHRKARRDRDIRQAINYILDTNPNVSESARHMCGFTTRSTAPLYLHTLDIGRNLWIARTPDLHKYERCLVFIGEKFNMEIDEATKVFDDKVLVEGSWLDIIDAQLEGAKKTAKLLRLNYDLAQKARDEARANAY